MISRVQFPVSGCKGRHIRQQLQYLKIGIVAMHSPTPKTVLLTNVPCRAKQES